MGRSPLSWAQNRSRFKVDECVLHAWHVNFFCDLGGIRRVPRGVEGGRQRRERRCVELRQGPEEHCVVHLREREFFIDNLLVRIHLIVEIILVERPCAMGV